jgi:DNA-binding transcriptional regulator YbjK
VSAAAPAPDRRTALLEATLQLIGEGGLGAVTHRAVERAAGLPHGSTTYYFKTRAQLLEAAVERLLEIDRARADEIVHAISRTLATRRPLGELDLDAIAAAIVAWLESDRTYQLARYELFVESARRPELKASMMAGATAFLRVLEPIVVAAGSHDPPRDARIALAMANGLMLEQLARPEPDFATAILPAALRKLLASMDER